jgi:5S rRNA maturation endonuclease (ribonuclease M5)
LRDLFPGNSHTATRKPSKVAKKTSATYDYTDENGALMFQVVRFEPKDFRQRRPDGQGGWISNLDGVRRVLYHLPEVIAAKDVLIVEGERDVETARQLGFVATCNSGGAGKWRDEYYKFLVGKDVIVIPDADEVGRRHAQQVLTSLAGKSKSLKLVELTGAKDFSDWIERGGTRQQLLDLIRRAQEWTPPPVPDGANLLRESSFRHI